MFFSALDFSVISTVNSVSSNVKVHQSLTLQETIALELVNEGVFS